MPCACGNKPSNGQSKTYVHTAPNGVKRTYKSEVEAAAATKRLGGTYRAS
jgi:hypothetical protein